MNNVLEFDVSVEKTKTYRISRKQFDKLNKEFELNLDFDNLSTDDLYKLFFEMDDTYIYDIEYRDTTIFDYDYLK